MTEFEEHLLHKTVIAEESLPCNYDPDRDAKAYNIICGDKEIIGMEGIWSWENDQEAANKAIAERIVACMNFCRGITNQQLRSGMFTIKEM